MSASSHPESELPAVGFLADVSSEHRAFLACFGKFIRPQPDDVLIKEGDPQESLYMILSGTLHIISENAGRQMLLASLGEGDSFGEVNLFDPGAVATKLRGMAMPGEDPMTLKTPEDLAPHLLRFATPSSQESGKVFDFPALALKTFREPA